MDGENNGKPENKMDDLGVPLYLETARYDLFHYTDWLIWWFKTLARHSMKYWLVNRDPYSGLWNNPYITGDCMSSPIYSKWPGFGHLGDGVPGRGGVSTLYALGGWNSMIYTVSTTDSWIYTCKIIIKNCMEIRWFMLKTPNCVCISSMSPF